MARWGMVIDLEQCTGCGACMAACKTENNVQVVPFEEAQRGRKMHWLMLLSRTAGEYPDVDVELQPNLCMMCDDPPCIKVCPVHATYKGVGGLVAQIYPRCIGCRYCMVACPYTVKFFNWTAARRGENLPPSHNPDVSLRPKGVVEKCTFCHHRLQMARESARERGRPVISEDYQPACVEICPADAMTFGDLDDPDSPVARLAVSQRAERLLEHLGTEPKVIFLKRRDSHV
ncbi:MAG: 4Fe-4S dicluster domain-containing protein [Acidobacteriota bacterium]